MTTKHPGLLSVSAAIMALLGGAAPSGLVAHGAEFQTTQHQIRKRDEEEDHEELLLAVPPDAAQVILASHRSHRSHSSHRSHRSHYSGSGSSSYRGSYESSQGSYEPSQAAPPPPPKPAKVSFVAYPGGSLYVDGKAVGEDSTAQLSLPAGKHSVRIDNRFLGSTVIDVDLSEGQTGEIKLEW